MADYYKTLDANYRLRIWISTQSQNTAANSSTVIFSLALEKTGSYTRWSGFSNPWSITVNGSTYSGSSTYDFRNYSSIDLLTNQTLVVPHNADGTKSISVSGSWDDATNGIPDGTVTGTYTLNSIPRTSAPRISAPHTDAGSAVTIYTDRASTAFTHEIQVFFGSIGTAIASNVTDSYVWTIPLSYLNEMPDTDRMFGTIRLRTFSGSTDLGYKDIAFAIRAGSTIVPTIASVTATEATAGLAANVGTGKYVQNITTLAIATSGAAGVYGSTIASTQITVAGQTINAASGTTAPINASGTVNVVATVTDTRGKTASKTLALTFTAYSAPQISNISVYRSTSGGVAQEDGTYVTVQFTGSVSSIMNTTERNARSYQIRSLDRTTNVWTVKQAFLAVTGVTSTVTRYLTAYSAENSFDFEIAVKDDFMTSTALRTVSVAKVFMHWNGSLGLGLGKYHTQGALDVEGDGYFSGKVSGATGTFTGAITQNGGKAVTDEGQYAAVANYAALPATGNRPGNIRRTTATGNQYIWDGTRWRYLMGDTVPWVRYETNEVYVNVGANGNRFITIPSQTEPMRLRVTVTTTMIAAANASANFKRYINGVITDNPGASGDNWHNQGRANMSIPTTFIFETDIPAGAAQTLGVNVANNALSSAVLGILNIQFHVQRIPG